MINIKNKKFKSNCLTLSELKPLIEKKEKMIKLNFFDYEHATNNAHRIRSYLRTYKLKGILKVRQDKETLYVFRVS